jgi:fructoselysine 6-kinase
MNAVCVADCGVDRYLDLGVERAGGIGLNVAVHLRRLLGAGDAVAVVAPLGDDAGADVVRRAVARERLTGCLPVRAGATPVQEIRHAPGGERVFGRYLEGVLAGYRLEREARELAAGSDLLVTAAFGQGLDLFESVAATPSRGLRAVDYTNLDDVGDPLAFVERHARSFDVSFFGLGTGDVTLVDGLERIARAASRLFVVTLGARGSLALGGAQRVEAAAAPCGEVVDTTGAGDAFVAGFLARRLAAGDVPACLAAGASVAASTLSHLGAFVDGPSR